MPATLNHPMRTGPEFEFRTRTALDDTQVISSLTLSFHRGTRP